MLTARVWFANFPSSWATTRTARGRRSPQQREPLALLAARATTWGTLRQLRSTSKDQDQDTLPDVLSLTEPEDQDGKSV